MILLREEVTYRMHLPGIKEHNQGGQSQPAADTTASGDPIDTMTTLSKESFFTGHQLRSGDAGPQPRTHNGFDWIFVITIAVLLIVTLIRYFSPKNFSLVLSAVISRSQASQFLRESNIFREQIFLPLLLVSFIAAGTYIFMLIQQLSDGTTFQEHVLTFLGYVILGYALFFLSKVFLIYISGKIFRNSDITFEYIHNLFLFHIFTSIVLLPFLITIPYFSSHFLIYLSMGVVFALFIMRFFRGLRIGLGDTKFSVFHLFLYLCTLEILPYLVVAKLAFQHVPLY